MGPNRHRGPIARCIQQNPKGRDSKMAEKTEKKTRRVRLSKQQKIAIYRAYQASTDTAEVEQQFNVSRATVYKISAAVKHGKLRIPRERAPKNGAADIAEASRAAAAERRPISELSKLGEANGAPVTLAAVLHENSVLRAALRLLLQGRLV